MASRSISEKSDLWILVDEFGKVKKVGNGNVVRRLMKKGDVRFKIKRFEKLEF